MHGWRRTVLAAILVGSVAIAGIALNFTLLRMTQDAHDPVGRLSPKAVILPRPATERSVTVPVPAPRPTDDDRARDD